jgi:iron complex outermembrane receptor protein
MARLLGPFVASGLLLHVAGACAQVAPVQGAATAGVEEIPEVLITAEKITENVEKAPLAVTAITGAEIAAQGVFSATDLSDMVPNFTAAPNSGGSTIAIRGIFTNAQVLTGTPEVSYSVDGVNLLQKEDAFEGMFDVSRVEVLRGPQGTLYGADANAGAINVITNKPDLSGASASGSASLGNYGARTITAVVICRCPTPSVSELQEMRIITTATRLS